MKVLVLQPEQQAVRYLRQKCSQCDKNFENEKDLIQHIHKDHVHKCSTCEIIFCNMECVKEHRKTLIEQNNLPQYIQRYICTFFNV